MGILQQSLTGIRGFDKSGKLEKKAILPMLAPTLAGAALGALSTTWLPPDVLKPVLLGAMIAIALVMLTFPDVVAPPEGTRTYSLRERPSGFLMLFGAGIYGGFVQAGVGFILIAALGGGPALRPRAHERPEGSMHGAVQRRVLWRSSYSLTGWSGFRASFLAVGMTAWQLLQCEDSR